MKPGIATTRVICKTCGDPFQRTSVYMQTECEDCRRGQPRRRFKAREKPDIADQWPNVVLPERFWTDWLIGRLDPFLGSEPVMVNKIILHLREQAAKVREVA